MSYRKVKQVSKICAKEDCGLPRLGRNRLCRKCQSEKERIRQRKKTEPVELLARAVREVKKRPGIIDQGFKQRLEELASVVAAQINDFNESARRAG